MKHYQNLTPRNYINPEKFLIENLFFIRNSNFRRKKYLFVIYPEGTRVYFRMFANLTGSLEQFPESPIDAWILFVVGWYMCFLMSAVVSVNGMLLVTFFGSRDLRQPINTFVICVTFLNFFGALIEFPFVIASNFAGKWVFGHLGCAMSGYSAYFVGSSSIYLMMAISFER